MDLLGDIGHADQLTSTREENRVLQAKVKELTVRVHELLAENQSLQAEVELYRRECALPSFSKLTLGGTDNDDNVVGGESKESFTDAMDDERDDFVTSGNGLYPDDPAVTLPQIHGHSNPLCCVLHPDDSTLATGGADSFLNLYRWGSALAPGDESAFKAVNDAIKISCGAPVICASFAQVNQGRGLPIVAAGCMDGSVRLVHCGLDICGSERILKPESVGREGVVNGINEKGIRHGKYVKNVVWSPNAPIVATASADGTVQLTKVGNLESIMSDADDGNTNLGTVSMEVVQSMHFDGPVESMCFLDDGDTLCCYVRGTSYLSYFDLKNDCKQTKVSLNGGSAGTGCFDEHVSFSVLSLLPSPNNGGKYLAAATDTSRNIILETRSERIVRNLYGHKNDGFSNPKIAWSSSGQVCVVYCSISVLVDGLLNIVID
ncbi:hypothetical protein ACHAXS_000540 [Conticribra weissflogii]